MKLPWYVLLRHLGLLLTCSWMHQVVQAQVHRFDQSPPLTAPTVIPDASPAQTEQAGGTKDTDTFRHQLTEKELSQYPRVMAQIIEQAIKTRQWEVLRLLLSQYQFNPQADPYLVLYAQGSLYRHDKNYPLAIGAFEALLYLKPELTYIRLDLAMMQIEDKRYGDAMANLTKVISEPNTVAQTKRLAEAYLKQLQKLQERELAFTGGFTRNDNVNQASTERTLELWGRKFVKNEESLPKEGNGFSYGVGIKKLLPLAGNHALLLAVQHTGTYYWDQKDYSERTLRINPAYLYQDYSHWIKVGPVYEKNWLGERQYGNRLGVQAEWGKQITPKHYLIPYIDFTRKRYDSLYLARYEGDSVKKGLTWFYQTQPGTNLSIGGHYQQDALTDLAESSKTLSIRLGGSYKTENGLNTQLNVHLGKRDFNAPNELFRYTRQDKEHMVSIGLWHSKINLMGITPKLVYRYSDIDSNISALYSRKSRGFMLEVVEIKF